MPLPVLLSVLTAPQPINTYITMPFLSFSCILSPQMLQYPVAGSRTCFLRASRWCSISSCWVIIRRSKYFWPSTASVTRCFALLYLPCSWLHVSCATVCSPFCSLYASFNKDNANSKGSFSVETNIEDSHELILIGGIGLSFLVGWSDCCHVNTVYGMLRYELTGALRCVRCEGIFTCTIGRMKREKCGTCETQILGWRQDQTVPHPPLPPFLWPLVRTSPPLASTLRSRDFPFAWTFLKSPNYFQLS